MKKVILISILSLIIFITVFAFIGDKKDYNKEYYYIPFSVAERKNKVTTYVGNEYFNKESNLISYSDYYTTGYELNDLYFIYKFEMDSTIKHSDVNEILKIGKESLKNNNYFFKYNNQSYKILNYYQFKYEYGAENIMMLSHTDTLKLKKDNKSNFITDFNLIPSNDAEYSLLFKSYDKNTNVYIKGMKFESFIVNNKKYTIDDLEFLNINSDLFFLCFEFWIINNNNKIVNSESIYITDNRCGKIDLIKYNNKYLSIIESKNGNNIDYYYNMFESKEDEDTIFNEKLRTGFIEGGVQ